MQWSNHDLTLWLNHTPPSTNRPFRSRIFGGTQRKLFHLLILSLLSRLFLNHVEVSTCSLLRSIHFSHISPQLHLLSILYHLLFQFFTSLILRNSLLYRKGWTFDLVQRIAGPFLEIFLALLTNRLKLDHHTVKWILLFRDLGGPLKLLVNTYLIYFGRFWNLFTDGQRGWSLR